MFWQEFEDRFGEVGRDPAAYYCLEVGHILHVTPDQVGEVSPSDLMGAVRMFDALYRGD